MSGVDVMHSYLGLAALAVMRHPDLKSIDPMLCMSVSAKENFERETALGRSLYWRDHPKYK